MVYKSYAIAIIYERKQICFKEVIKLAAKYKKCPRCELNYILVEEELCPVCKAELKLTPSESEDDLELCTFCGKNFITVDQVMCDECSKKRSLDDVVDEVIDNEEGSDIDWDEAAAEQKNELGEVVDDDDTDYEDIDSDSFDDEDEETEEVEETYDDEDDFDIGNIDDIDFSEDDEEDEDDDDDDYDFLQKKKK